MIYVLLTDDDNGTALVACPDEDTAEKVGAAAIYSNGGVSAWRVPTLALTNADRVAGMLRDHVSTWELHEGNPDYAPIQTD